MSKYSKVKPKQTRRHTGKQADRQTHRQYENVNLSAYVGSNDR